MKTNWDYTSLAATYDQRADYSGIAISRLLETIGASEDKPIADIGAGTGKLTKMLQRFTVKAIEPNDAMRSLGMKNAPHAEWRVGTAEATGLPETSVYAALFGSSFNVTDQQSALKEVYRILVPGGWFACMWNHRDLTDPLQIRIESIIRSHLPGYDYGSRREDPTPEIDRSGLFAPVRFIEERFTVSMPKAEAVAAWRSHGTLQRQAGDKFDAIVAAIAAVIPDTMKVPYHTRIWCAYLTAPKDGWKAEMYAATE